MHDPALLSELAPHAERLYERHLTTCKPWYPHEAVPWGRGRDFVPGDTWDENDFPLPAAVRSALFVNLLTEDNLPYYFETINRLYGREGIWKTWSHRWVAEEGRHAQAIRDYLLVTRAIDPWALEDGRMGQMSGGEVPQPASAADGLVYVALQELATRIAHRNTGRLLAESDHPAAQAGYELLSRVAADENFHYLFYRDLTSAAIEIDPSAVVCAIERQIREFEMPGTGIANFNRHAKAIAQAGIYNLEQHHGQILLPVVMRWWKLESIEGLSPEAELARERTIRAIERTGELARRLAARAERLRATPADLVGASPVV